MGNATYRISILLPIIILSTGIAIHLSNPTSFLIPNLNIKTLLGTSHMSETTQEMPQLKYLTKPLLSELNTWWLRGVPDGYNSALPMEIFGRWFGSNETLDKECGLVILFTLSLNVIPLRFSGSRTDVRIIHGSTIRRA